MKAETAEEFLKKHGDLNDYIQKKVEQRLAIIELNNEPEKEEVESGWIILDPDGNELWKTFKEEANTCIKNFIKHYSWFDWVWKQVRGYKCVRATRITRLTKTSEG